MDRAFRYCEGVESGRIIVGHEIKLAVKRFRKDILEYDLNEHEASKAIAFTEMLRFSKGKKAKQRIVWEDWQIFALVNVFGFYHKGGGRRFRYFYIEVARKNGKSTFLAAIALCFLMLFDEAVPELYCGASVKDQARPVFDEMGRMINHLRGDFKEFENKFGVFKEKIEFFENEGIVEMVTAVAKTKDGLNPMCTILDEVHAHKDDSLFNVFKSGMGGRDNNTPIICMVTTAGFSLTSFAYMIRKNFIQVLEDSKVDESTFILIYSLDKNDDYIDKSTWVKANPSLGASFSQDYIDDEFVQAQNFDIQLNNFLTKNLNIWVGGAETWIDRKTLDENDKDKELTEVELEEIMDGSVYLGLDLGLVRDISALAQITIFADERIHVKMRYYMSDVAYRRFISKGIPMDSWRRHGISINVNPGKVTDTRVIREDIIEITESLTIEQIGVDRWGTNILLTELQEEGIEVADIGQGYKTQAEIVQFIERAMAEGRFHLIDDDMLKWMFGNVALDMDPAGNQKLNKKRSDDKIDGVSALFNALAGFVHVDNGMEQMRGIRSVRIG